MNNAAVRSAHGSLSLDRLREADGPFIHARAGEVNDE